ncbi:HD domain-containing protein [Williamsia sp. Leaf354]|uniref:HD domain-containing protein n=1 Tax=Williamsia sp. Leaf354 TaxID=1736349 RepID=UPI001F186143|nr:hypothetical protein [Williamsia sp. Leaf354]
MNDPVCRYLSPDLTADLLARWRQPHRRYHTVDHLSAVLQAVDVLVHDGVEFDREPVEIAAWFHDAVYEIGSSDNEERSAALALSSLENTPTAAEAARLVRVTADHRPVGDDVNAAALCDADLAVLAGTEDEYATYADRVRDEYRAVPDDVLNAGRAQLLTHHARRGDAISHLVRKGALGEPGPR